MPISMRFPLLVLMLAGVTCGHAAETPAQLCDSGSRTNRNDVALFYVDKINGKRTSPTALTNSGKDPNAAGFRVRIQTRIREVHGPTRLRIQGRPMSIPIWVSDGRPVEGEVQLDPAAGTVYRVAGVLGPDYSAVWIEDSEGIRVTDIVESLGKDPAKAEAARETTLAASTSGIPPDRREAFLQMEEGECEAIINARFGEPDNRHTVGRALGNRFEVLEYHDIGDAWMQHGSLQRVLPAMPATVASEQSADTVRQSLAQIQHDSLRITAAGYARAGITDPDMLDAMADFIWQNHKAKDRSTADAAAHLCHALGNSRNPRYRNLLERVASEASTAGLRRHASRNLELLSGDTDMPYEPWE